MWVNLALAIEGGSQFAQLSQSADRFGIVADAFALAQSGLLNTTTALVIASQLVDEDSVPVWVAALENLAFIHGVLQYDPINHHFEVHFARCQHTPLKSLL